MRPDLISFFLCLSLGTGGGFLLGAGYMTGGAICLLLMCGFVWDLIAQWHHDEQRAAEDEYMRQTREG